MTCLATSTVTKSKNGVSPYRNSKTVTGRPPSLKSEKALKPWLAEGISERTYHRRKKPTHDAHVAVWHALGFFERQDLVKAARKLRIAAAPSKPFGQEIEMLLRKRAAA